MTTITRYHHEAVEEFEVARRRAQWYVLYTTLLGRENRLVSFSSVRPFGGHRQYRGIREIPTQAIVGSISRNSDFDRDFRPLGQHLLARWVRAYVLAHTSGWSPIRVCQVGDLYFVEDGHHRVSVARHLNIDRIEAEVWEYPENTDIGFQQVLPAEACLADRGCSKCTAGLGYEAKDMRGSLNVVR